MQLKRFVSGVCAASIAVTQTAVVPISVSATEYNYKEVPGFTDQYKVTLGTFSTTGTTDKENDVWDGISPVAPSVGKATFNSSTHAVNEDPTPDEAKNVGFYFSCDIDDGYYQAGDKFDFTVYDLTLSLNKNVSESVTASEESVSNGDLLSTSSPIKISAYPKAIKDSMIIVTYAIADISVGSEAELSPELDITNADGESIAGGAAFDSAKTTFEATLDESTAKDVAESGFILKGNHINVIDVTISVPEHTVSDTPNEILSNGGKYTWTLECADDRFNGNLEFHPSEITFADFKDFIDNGSVTAEWSKIECKSRRISFDSINSELWSGEESLDSQSDLIKLPRFDLAEKYSRLVIEYTPETPADADGDAVVSSIKFVSTSGASDRNNIPVLHEDADEEGVITLDKDSSKITVTLTQAAADELNNGTLAIGGENVCVTKVTSLEADPNTPADIELNEDNFPNQTFREYISENCDKNNDGKLTYFELEKLSSINFDEEKYHNIDDLTGIGYLSNLKYLNICGNNAIKTIDVSDCSKLEYLYAGNCIHLANAVLPDGIKEISLFNTSIKEISTEKFKDLEKLTVSNSKIKGLDLSKNTKLKELDISNNEFENGIDISNCRDLVTFSANSCGLKKLDVSKNTKLENISTATNNSIEFIGLDKLSSLLTLKVTDCGLTKLDVSKNTNLGLLEISYNSIAAIDLTGLDNLTTFYAANQIYDITLINNTFNLTKLDDCGFDISKMTLNADDDGVTRSGNILTFDENTENVGYIYDTGIEDKPLYVTLNVDERIESNYTVSYVDGDTPMTVAADEWSDVLKTMNNKDIDYAVFLNNDVEVAKLTFPTAAKAKSIAIYSTSAKTITTAAAAVTLPIDTTFGNINIESTAKNFSITASKNLSLSDFQSDTLKTLKGSTKSVLIFMEGLDNTIKADISGFGNVWVERNSEVELLGTVKVNTIKLNNCANVVVKNNSVTFTNIEVDGEMASICYSTDNFKPVTVTGNITSADSANKLYIYKRNSETLNSELFSAGQSVLTAKTASIANVSVHEDSMPEGDISYTLARVGSDIKLLAEKIKLETIFYGPGQNETVYAQWSDVLSTIAANAKAGQTGNSYHVTLLDDYDMNGAFKMPAAKTYSSINFTSEQTVKTITFTGNITLTGITKFNNIKLDAQKIVNKQPKSVDFTIAAGKNALRLEYVNANIKSITSSGEVELTGVTVGTLTANEVLVSPNEVMITSAMGAAWDGKSAPKTTVNITGNLTAKTLLVMNGRSSLSVGGILNAGKISALEDTVLVVKQQAKGKNALVIGKNGIDNSSEKISFVLVDPATGLTAEITEDVILGTIAGPYADQLVPSNDNLIEADSYYIIKSGKNLIAKPKASAGLVTVEINGKTAHYKNLNEAITDINAMGSKDDNIVIYLTQDMFPNAVAKLPLPSAGKYDTLTYTASENVTINMTGDLALTGDLILGEHIALNKVDKADNVTALGVNVGKYSLTVNGSVSETSVKDSIVNRFANISGAGKLCIGDIYIDIAGKVNGTTLVLDDSVVSLGSKASFAGSIESDDAMLVYDKSIAKNVKFTNITGVLELVVNDGEKTAELAENTIVASVTGDYTKGAVIIDGSDLKVVRSGNDLKTVKEENVITVEAYDSDQNLTATRTYDSLASAMNDISRINDTKAIYKVIVTKEDTFTLPKANTYAGISYVGESSSSAPITLTTTGDLNLTGDLELDNIILNKVDRSGNPVAMSVNLGTYSLNTENAHISYNGKVSQFTNINGKGSVQINDPMTVSGKINVNIFHVADEVTLSSKSAFTAVYAYDDGGSLSYPLSIGKNIVFTDITGNIKVKIDGVKAGDQIATVKGDYIYNSIIINDGKVLSAVRSGNKLVAADRSSTNYITVREYNSNIIRSYDSIASAITDITRLNDAKGYYIFDLNAGEYNIPRLTLPAKGKCDIIAISTGLGTVVTITVSSDIALTCDLRFGGDLTIQKEDQKALKFTSPKDKNGSPVYRVYVDSYAYVINGTLNGEPITDTTP